MENKEKRKHTIIIFSIISIVMNILLSILKIIVGTLVNAQAIVLDGINGVSDVVSSFLTIIGSIVVEKKPDRDHPMGYGRIEYVFSTLITIMIIYIGGKSMIQAIGDVIKPDIPPHYTVTAIILMITSMVCKLVFGIVMRNKGKKIDSVSMIMTGSDSLSDAMVSAAILISIIIYRATGVDVESYLCIVIACMIMYTGYTMIKECLTKLLGTRADPEFKKKIMDTLMKEDEVLNVFNLVIHNYGEDIYIGSVDIEVDDRMTADRITMLSRRLIKKTEELGLTLTSVGISATNVRSKRAAKIYDDIIETVRHYKDIKRAQSFSIDFKDKIMSFYIVQDFGDMNRDEQRQKLLAELQEKYPDMTIDIYSAIDM